MTDPELYLLRGLLAAATNHAPWDKLPWAKIDGLLRVEVQYHEDPYREGWAVWTARLVPGEGRPGDWFRRDPKRLETLYWTREHAIEAAQTWLAKPWDPHQ